MICAETVECIDINNTYFGIVNIKYGYLFFDEEGETVTSMNRVIPKPYAIDKALDYFKTQKTEFSKLYISVDALKVKHIKDYMNKVIFKDIDGNLSGWLFCFDPTPFANWGHQCVYLFVISDRNYQEVKYDMGLNENILMEKIY